eukprot:TRINITY_DN1387_c0_g1_i1.p2 TRINITY_DN1387_c0_g1~~TRINITY_DN1387_c0_g1_i1.p2  ORF type:complete len:293 (+),score=36.14 TRINITY_DN1387_c0_g1_i1:1976-2854(+)
MRVKKCRSNSPTLKREKCVHRKEEQLQAEIEKRQKEYKERLVKSEKKLSTLREKLSKTVALKKENRDKKLLRSRIHRIFLEDSKQNCEKYIRQERRWISLVKTTKNQYEVPAVTPGKSLRRMLTLDELNQVKEDLHYFLPQEEAKKEILEEKPVKSRANTKKLPKRRKLKMDQLRPYNTVDNTAKFELLHKRQEENYEYELRKSEIQKEILLHKFEEKYNLAKAGVETIQKQRKSAIAEQSRREALHFYKGVSKRYAQMVEIIYVGRQEQYRTFYGKDTWKSQVLNTKEGRL